MQRVVVGCASGIVVVFVLAVVTAVKESRVQKAAFSVELPVPALPSHE